jgi:hypothetical protein
MSRMLWPRLPPKADMETFGYSEGMGTAKQTSMTMPRNAGSDHYCEQHDEDGRVHVASMCHTPQARHSKV